MHDHEFDFTIDADSRHGGQYRGHYRAASEEAAFEMARRDLAAREAEENLQMMNGDRRLDDGSLARTRSRAPGTAQADTSMGSGPSGGGSSALVFAAVLLVLMVIIAIVM